MPEKLRLAFAHFAEVRQGRTTRPRWTAPSGPATPPCAAPADGPPALAVLAAAPAGRDRRGGGARRTAPSRNGFVERLVPLLCVNLCPSSARPVELEAGNPARRAAVVRRRYSAARIAG